MLAWDGRGPCRQSLYNRTLVLRLCRWLGRPWPIGVGPIAAMLLALAVSGCSYQLASLVSSDDSEPQSTGTIKQPPAASSGAPSKASSQTELDLAYARSAASEALSRGGKGGSVPWQNPHSGAGGNITPLATSYSDAGIACRDFLASYIHGAAQDWLEGAACRTDSGTWEVKRLKPLKSS